MNQYVTGAMIKRLREKKGLTQSELAEKINVTDKAVSKWETGRGYPDVSLIEPLSSALGVSVIELFAGERVVNTNRAGKMTRVQFYVCPVCANVIESTGEVVVSCCGLTLPALEAEPCDENHNMSIERTEDEYFVSLSHEMTKTHYISFIAYPEQEAQARFKISGTRYFLFYCNRHGLFMQAVHK